MKDFHIAVAAVTSVILFVFGLENFSKEIQKIAGEKFRKFLGRATSFSIFGVAIGALITAFIQSSSATSVIAISLVNAGVLSFKNSVGIIFGSNIGTTVTAQLVAFKLTYFAPAFIIAGFALSFVRSRYSVFAKSLFYFGFVFFTLNLISSTLKPLQDDQRVIEFLTQAQSPYLGILIGCLVTAIIQSSSVTTGLAVIFTQQGLMSLENAIPILMGANIGTTVTALISIINMDMSAKKTAMAHLFFNVGGVLLFLPVVLYWGSDFPLFSDNPAIALANFHFIFNIITSAVFVAFIKPFVRFIDKIWGEGKMDFERLDLTFFQEESSYKDVKNHLPKNLEGLFGFVQENYNMVTLSIETNYKGVHETAQKRIEYIDFVRGEALDAFAGIVGRSTNEKESEEIIKAMGPYEYIFQIHDSVKDLLKIKHSIDKKCIELKSDLLVIVREISSETLSFFNHISKEAHQGCDREKSKKQERSLQEKIDEFHGDILRLAAQPRRQDAGLTIQLITYSQRLKDKLVNYSATFNGERPRELATMRRVIKKAA